MSDNARTGMYLNLPQNELPQTLKATIMNVRPAYRTSADCVADIIKAWLRAGQVELTEEQVLNGWPLREDE